jgi:hypothetical protein
MQLYNILACSTCRVTMIEGGGDEAGWSIFALLVVILGMMAACGIFMAKIARRERQFLDPELMDDYVPGKH